MWPAGRADVVRCLLPAPSVEFFTQRGGQWYRFGNRLPTSAGPPAEEGVPVANLVHLERIVPVIPAAQSTPPVLLRIVRGGGPKQATALACRIMDLMRWVDTATTAELTAVQGTRSGSRAVLLGSRLPSINHAIRYWGTEIYSPVGFRPDPDLPSNLLRDAIGTSSDELVFLDEEGVEVIPRAAFAPLSRAGVRLASREHEHMTDHP
ncbi:hypothetical protein FRUB_00043 [Fimbriiglobus ruber]|uniref:MoxR-vWA-beta-propeller ternary system domain-containing protein n=1 Tax=Fimbriiglobus ruber TaxID=1908690 RepID=A0A225E3L1_9BACT|nr:hypothetical protein FRUB_00043 [Fimbriiglobus ruber]